MKEQEVTIISISWKRSYENKKYGGSIHIFSATVENSEGTPLDVIFTTTKQDQTKFKVGEKVTVNFKKSEEDHQQVWKIDKVSDKGSGSGGYGGKNNPKKDRSILANVALYCAFEFLKNHNQATAVKEDMQGIFTIADKVYAFLTENAKDTQTSINIQACVKRVAEYIHLFPGTEVKTSTSALEAASKLHEWVNQKMG